MKFIKVIAWGALLLCFARAVPTTFSSAAATTANSGPVISKFGANNVIGFALQGNMTRAANQARDIGLARTAEGVPWEVVERTPGVYDFSQTDPFINNALAGGMEPFVALGLTPKFYSPNPNDPQYNYYPPTSAQGLTAWNNYVQAAVNRYKNNVHMWEIFPNVTDLNLDTATRMAQYKELLQRAYPIIKAADPTAIVVTAPLTFSMMIALANAGGGPYFDKIGFPNYAEPYAPEASVLISHNLNKVRDLSARLFGGKPIIVVEGGWPTVVGDPRGVSEDLEAAYLIRAFLQQGALPDVHGVFWTAFTDIPAGGAYTTNDYNDNFGMVLHVDSTKKPAYDAYKAMTTALAGASFVRYNWPATTSTQTLEDFEGARTYSLFQSGASGSYAKDCTTAHTGGCSGRIGFTSSATGSGSISVAPNPDFFLPINGLPARVRLWARKNATDPALQLSIGLADASNNVANAFVGVVDSTEWKEYSYYLDTPPGTSGIGPDSNFHPTRFTGILVANWPLLNSPASGTVWVDDLRIEYGPTVFDMEFSGPSGPVHALWSLNGVQSVSIPAPGPVATVRDWRNTTSTLAASNGQVTLAVDHHPVFVSFLQPTTQVSAADFDGDGKDDIAIYRPSDQSWWILQSSKGYSTAFADIVVRFWGAPGDLPVTGDFDGDSKSDFGVFRPSNATWWILQSSRGYSGAGSDILFKSWYAAGDIPLVGDFDRDGRADFATFNPNNQSWHVLTSASGYNPASAIVKSWGAPGDQPIIGDFDKDAKADIGIFRPSDRSWWILLSSKNYSASQSNVLVKFWGAPGDQPVIADFDGDTQADIGVFRPSDRTWWILQSSQLYSPAAGNILVKQWGAPADLPIVGYFDTDIPSRKADIGVFRPTDRTWWITLSSNGYSSSFANILYRGWGVAGDTPLAGPIR